MKIAIISDTHDNLARLDKFLAYIAKNPVETVIHCGDIASGETLQQLAKGFDGPPQSGARLARTGGKIYAAFGNMDYRESVIAATKKLPEQVLLFEEFGQAELGGLKIGFCHHKETGVRQNQSKKFDFIFYGHSHKPWLETIDGCLFANPGNLAGLIFKATFALLDTKTKNLELKILDQL